MLESEAKTKWCPQTQKRVIVVISEHDQRRDKIVSDERKGTFCIASECMWWVWDIETVGDTDIHDEYGHCGAIK